MKRNIGRAPALCPTLAVIIGAIANHNVYWLFTGEAVPIDTDHLFVSLPASQLATEAIRQNGRFSANLVSERMLPKVEALRKPNGTNEERAQTLSWLLGEAGTPIIDMSPLALECAVAESYRTEAHDNFICQVSHTYADEDILDSAGRIDYERLKPVLFESPTGSFLRTGGRIAREAAGAARPLAAPLH